MCPTDVEFVFGYLEASDCPPDVAERSRRMLAKLVQTREGPVEPDPRVRVCDLVGLGERALEHSLRTTEITEVAQRVAQIGRKPNLIHRVFRAFLRNTSQAALKEVDGPLRLAEGRVALAERCVDVRPLRRREEIRADRLLQALRGGRVVSGSRLREADRYACAEPRGRVAGRA